MSVNPADSEILGTLFGTDEMRASPDRELKRMKVQQAARRAGARIVGRRIIGRSMTPEIQHKASSRTRFRLKPGTCAP